MAKCGNCKSTMGCSCKLRKASDGKACCVNCISNYEKVIKQAKKKLGTNPTGVILKTTAIQKK